MAWDVVYYREANDDVPALDFLLDPKLCPTKVRATLFAVLEAVAAAPPPRFSGGGLWEAMHGDMGGFYEVRTQGAPNRTQYRLFCVLENGSADDLKHRGLERPAIAVITGMSKPWMTTFSDKDYRMVSVLGREHSAQFPRRIAE